MQQNTFVVVLSYNGHIIRKQTTSKDYMENCLNTIKTKLILIRIQYSMNQQTDFIEILTNPSVKVALRLVYI